MPEQKSGKYREQKSAITLRRSPRFLHLDPQTPEPVPKKIRAVHLASTPTLISISKSSKNREEISAKGEKEILAKPKKGRGKSAGNDLDFQKQNAMEKRVTRSSVLQRKFVSNLVGKCVLVNDSRISILSKKENNKVSVKLRKQCVGNIEKRVTRDLQEKQRVVEKRVTRSSLRPSKCANQVFECVSDERAVILSKEGNDKGFNRPNRCIDSISKGATRSLSQRKTNDQVVNGYDELSGVDSNKEDEKECDSESESRDNNCGRKKRKRNHLEKESEIVRGWTEEQESSLRRAYFTAKATSHFWKKVARMVPGKSAEECFDRIHKDHSTPPQPNKRSRARTKSSPISLSASKLLSPAKTKIKRLRSSKKSCLLAQKTVRQLLQKQHKEDQDYGADFFSILEKNSNLSPSIFREGTQFSSPSPNLVGPSRLRRCVEMSSSSGHKKLLSRLSSCSKSAFVSPPVLKQIKNKALHEKYIDQLHCRDAKRKRDLKRTVKCNQGRNVEKANSFRVEAVKAAKDALMFEAQDAIKQFRSLQSSVLDDTDDSYLSNEEDGGDDEL